MKQSYPRLRSVNFKSGGYLRALPDNDTTNAVQLRTDLKSFAEKAFEHYGHKLTAVAAVAWSQDKSHYTMLQTRRGTPVSSTEIPNAAKHALTRCLWKMDQYED